ncbi:MAG: hypothetical protein HY906_00410 [Deltaproteobacteria bacterium]|nr:hypothetical protein [Deltaproteobacteria bacterium]
MRGALRAGVWLGVVLVAPACGSHAGAGLDAGTADGAPADGSTAADGAVADASAPDARLTSCAFDYDQVFTYVLPTSWAVASPPEPPAQPAGGANSGQIAHVDPPPPARVWPAVTCR